MAYGRRGGTQVAGKSMASLRQSGMFEIHPEDCTCRKCRRARAARARRVKPRYGQKAHQGGTGEDA